MAYFQYICTPKACLYALAGANRLVEGPRICRGKSVQGFRSSDIYPTMYYFYATIIILLVSVLLMAFKVLTVKGSRFPDGHAHSSPELRRKGIGCAHRPDSPNKH